MPPFIKTPSIRLKSYGELTPDDVAKIGEVFVLTGSYSDAADAAGTSPASARRALRRLAPALREEVLARSLEDAALTAVEEVVTSLEVLSASRKGAKTLGDKVTIVEAINETAKVVSTMRVAESKMRGDHAPTKVSANVSAQFSNLTDDELEREIAALVQKTLGGS